MENQPKVKIYSTPACPYCVTLKEYLKEKGFEFEDIDVSQDQNALNEMIEKSGQMHVPVLQIGETIVIGFDREKINGLLNIKE
ncbi:MAG: NrdH-redoxin [Candidatus Nealsonbacteria bacterium RIFOXYB1_FULL_40_15]|uniref:NrdH-redoxin n=2 Tax=Candidatus Nealsoniibacteriota TaxID=1817911 RepID=A0A1G2ERG4_9BACT|nr:MAG: NrdH-redoxin [Candidatus Nealsonbacteria bacterium RIFOXYB1_FULL_40_15]OGZ28373.1 MAG: NrdH-redoxin [Candidatus Nealsonbacteria bacterium RIFOXYC1_FULL_40_7]OGZ29498.1 MAG: NrdH-redoxin [Candidatus Nealsonbacteria bacterium RIFOXYD1_FULL_39_11]